MTVGCKVGPGRGQVICSKESAEEGREEHDADGDGDVNKVVVDIDEVEGVADQKVTEHVLLGLGDGGKEFRGRRRSMGCDLEFLQGGVQDTTEMLDGIAKARPVRARDRKEALVDSDQCGIDHEFEAGEEGEALEELSAQEGESVPRCRGECPQQRRVDPLCVAQAVEGRVHW